MTISNPAQSIYYLTKKQNMTSNDANEELKQQIEDNIRCPLCLDNFDDPRILPCSHTFCLKCLKQLAASNHGKFKCPLRDSANEIAANKIDALPINRIVRGIVDLVKQNTSKSKSFLRNEIIFLHSVHA